MEDLKNFFQDKNSFIVILPPNPSIDLVSAGLSLHLSLKNSGKQSQIGCTGPIPHIPNIDNISEIVDSIGSKNLIISFDYPEEYLEKVDYDVLPGGKFCLMIKPKNGSPVPKTSEVKYSYSGAEADLVIVLGVNSLEELGKIYADEKKFLDEAKIISLNNNSSTPSFTPNVFHHNISSFSEVVSMFIERLALNVTPQAATTLIRQIHESTSAFSSRSTTADTFSTIAYLMKNGGQLPGTSAPQFPRFTPPAFFEAPTQPEPTPADDPDDIPPDWTAPKIFRAASQS